MGNGDAGQGQQTAARLSMGRGTHRGVLRGPCAALPSRVAFACPPGAEVGDRRDPRAAGRDTWGRARGECRPPRWRETAGGWPRPAAPGAGGGCRDGWN